MSTTMVPLLVTPAPLVVAAPDVPAADPEAGAADPEELPAALEELDVLEVAVLLLLLQAATPTNKEAATQPAVHLRIRI